MRIWKIIIAVSLILFMGAGYSLAASYDEAEKLIDSGDYVTAEEMLRKLMAAKGSARGHRLLGDSLRKQGRLDEALSEYESSKKMGGEDVKLLKSMGEAYEWRREYGQAAESYRKALKLSPNDREARQDLRDLDLKRGLRVDLLMGGWEADNTTEKYEASLQYSGIDRFDMSGGYNYSDNPFYSRHKAFASVYYFYDAGSYFKTAAAYKDYNYPEATATASPDSNSYDRVPSIEFELSHWFNPRFRGSVAYEFFRPNFLYDEDSTADNHKVSTELYYITRLEWLRLKVMYAILMDPDPGKTTIKGRGLNMPSGRTAASTNVEYQTQSLLGGGVEISRDGWDAEVKYLPNRDLDRSYAWSILAGVGYDLTERHTVRFDYVHDKYSADSAYTGRSANVYLGSLLYEYSETTGLGFGLKHMDLPTGGENTGFFSISYRTGMGI